MTLDKLNIKFYIKNIQYNLELIFLLLVKLSI